MKIFGLAGWSGSGKTTLMVQLVKILCERGLRVSTVKHAHHKFDVDQPGKDSFRHREAGATEVMVCSGNRWALMHELRDEPEPPLTDLITHMTQVDLLLIEGFKAHPHDKLEIHRPSVGKPALWPEDPHIVAIASDEDLGDVKLPWLNLNDPEAIADFILARTGLTAG